MFQESKRAFFYSIVTEGGDKEKLEAFVNFCEDAIFEMTHASALMDVEDSSGGGKARESAYSYISEDEEERLVRFGSVCSRKELVVLILILILIVIFRNAKDPVKRSIAAVKNGISMFFQALSPGNIKTKLGEFQQLSPVEQVTAFFKMFFYIFYYSGYGVAAVIK